MFPKVDVNETTFGLNKDVNVAICGDAKLAAESILEDLDNMSPPESLKNAEERVANAQRERAEWQAELDAMSVNDDDKIAPRHALKELEKALPKVMT